MSDIIFTSGTTGAPKGAMLRHGASVRLYAAWSDVVGLRHGDRYLLIYPLFHTAGLKSGLLASLLKGATLLPHLVFDPQTVMATVQAERVTMLPGPPAIYQTILNTDVSEYDLSSLRLAVTGAAVVPVELVVKLRDELGFDSVVTGYGLTETTGTVAMCRHDDDPEIIAHTSGRPLDGIEMKIVDADGNELPTGEQGEIVTRGYQVMIGYFDNPEATAETVDADGWLHTGDVGYVDAQNNVTITDRIKDMFIVGGFNAYPAEIEGLMLEHPDVAQVAIVGVPDERMGEVGMAFVVPTAGHTVDRDAVLAWAREHMANFKAPRYLEVVDALPLNASGKVLKFELRRAREERSQRLTRPRARRTDNTRTRPRITNSAATAICVVSAWPPVKASFPVGAGISSGAPPGDVGAFGSVGPVGPVGPVGSSGVLATPSTGAPGSRISPLATLSSSPRPPSTRWSRHPFGSGCAPVPDGVTKSNSYHDDAAPGEGGP